MKVNVEGPLPAPIQHLLDALGPREGNIIDAITGRESKGTIIVEEEETLETLAASYRGLTVYTLIEGMEKVQPIILGMEWMIAALEAAEPPASTTPPKP